MKEKIKELALKAYEKSPFLCGLACGYFGRSVISFAVSVLFPLAKLLLG